jgi:pyruvate dehydrogenase kinase 2/3/4
LDLVHQPKPTTPQAEQDFGFLLNQLYQNHSNVLRQMARGILELKYQHPDVLNDSQFAASDEAFLDRFYMSRVGIRVLAGQYLALRHQLLNDPMGNIPPEYVGMISKQTSPSRIVQRAVEDATLLCQEQYPGQTPPKVHVSGKMQLTFCYIPTHLHYILLELIKNSMRATMEHHAHLKDKPPILVTIADGTNNEDVIIKVSDQGGGIPRSEMDQIWSYLFTTASSQVQQEFFQATQQVVCTENGAILAGLGYGLPLSRAYARYFGGELDLASMEGYGTDAFCHLVRLADRAQLLDDSSSNSTSSVVAPDASATNPVATRTMKC